MSLPKIILIGAGGHARSCIDVVEQQGRYNIAGLVGLPEQVNSKQLGYPVIGSDEAFAELAKTYDYALITIGQLKSAERRFGLHRQLIECGFQLPVIISPSAQVSQHSTIGAGTIVMHGAVINAGAKVGSNCIVNSCALVEHDAMVDDHCHISTGAILNGGVSVGKFTFVGSGSVVKEGVSIGEHCVVGMGVKVRHEISNNTRFIG